MLGTMAEYHELLGRQQCAATVWAAILPDSSDTVHIAAKEATLVLLISANLWDAVHDLAEVLRIML